MSKTIKDVISVMDGSQINLLDFLVGYSVKESKFHPIIIQYKNGEKPIEGDYYVDSWYPLFDSFTDEQKLITIRLCRKAMNADYYPCLGELFVNNYLDMTVKED